MLYEFFCFPTRQFIVLLAFNVLKEAISEYTMEEILYKYVGHEKKFG